MEHELPLLDKQQEQNPELEDYVQSTDATPLQSSWLLERVCSRMTGRKADALAALLQSRRD